MRTHFVAELPNMSDMWGEGVYLAVSHASHPKTVEFQGSSFFFWGGGWFSYTYAFVTELPSQNSAY